jgi:hypothetical protein
LEIAEEGAARGAVSGLRMFSGESDLLKCGTVPLSFLLWNKRLGIYYLKCHLEMNEE